MVIVQKPLMQALEDEGKVLPGSLAVLARSGLAMAVRAAAPVPDIGTVEALKRVLLQAKSIACPDPRQGHLSGVHFRAITERLGLTVALAPKTRFMDGALADFASTDEDEIAITQPMEILAAPGYKPASWLPAALQDEEKFTWAVGLSANAAEAHGADLLIRFLCSPEAAAMIEAKGMIAGANSKSQF